MSSENKSKFKIGQLQNNNFEGFNLDEIDAEIEVSSSEDAGYERNITGKRSSHQHQPIHQNQAFLDVTKVMSNQSETIVKMTDQLGDQERQSAKYRRIISQISLDLKQAKTDFEENVVNIKKDFEEKLSKVNDELKKSSSNLTSECEAHSLTRDKLAAGSERLIIVEEKLKDAKKELKYFKNGKGPVGWACSTILKRGMKTLD